MSIRKEAVGKFRQDMERVYLFGEKISLPKPIRRPTPPDCGCGGKARWLGASRTSFSADLKIHFLQCNECGMESPQDRTCEESVRIWKRAMKNE